MTVRMGKCETKVRLGDGASSLYAVDVANPERAYSLVLSIPNPVSPKALGMSDDARLLGFALKWLRIVPPPALMDRILAAVSRTR